MISEFQVAHSQPTVRGLHALAASERPQERLARCGAAVLSDAELLAMLLRSGSKERDVLTVAQDLLREAGSLAGLLRWSAEDFRRQHGVGEVKALQLLAVIEMARRILATAPASEPVFNEAAAAYRFLYPHLVGLERESFVVLCLNRKNRLLKFEVLTRGTGSAALVHPAEFFRPAIRAGATAVIAAHNHPSGDPKPSAADHQVTQQLRAAAKVLDIGLLDHVIVGEPGKDPLGRGYFSFGEELGW